MGVMDGFVLVELNCGQGRCIASPKPKPSILTKILSSANDYLAFDASYQVGLSCGLPKCSITFALWVQMLIRADE